MTADEDDPFSVFGANASSSTSNDDDDDGGDDDNDPATSSARALPRRDASCGVLVFHRGTEQALLQYVRNQMDSSGLLGKKKEEEQNDGNPSIDPRIAWLEQILRSVDEFCTSRHWMMHIGPQKGRIMESFLTECCLEKVKLNSSLNMYLPKMLIIVELGTYCGYSLLRMVTTMLKQGNMLFHIITVDIDPQNLAVAKELIKLAGIESYVTFLQLEGRADKELSTILQSAITTQTIVTDQSHAPNVEPKIDFLFIDHDKDLYLSDLIQLEESGLIRAGTFVCADNVVQFQLDEYRQHMANFSAPQSPNNDEKGVGIVRTRLEMSQLEYVIHDTVKQEAPHWDLRDGIGESIFLLVRVACSASRAQVSRNWKCSLRAYRNDGLHQRSTLS